MYMLFNSDKLNRCIFWLIKSYCMTFDEPFLDEIVTLRDVPSVFVFELITIKPPLSFKPKEHDKTDD